MLGFGPIGEYAIGEVLHDFAANFDQATLASGSSIVQTVSLFERALIQQL
jgi:hypothetical protein